MQNMTCSCTHECGLAGSLPLPLMTDQMSVAEIHHQFMMGLQTLQQHYSQQLARAAENGLLPLPCAMVWIWMCGCVDVNVWMLMCGCVIS